MRKLLVFALLLLAISTQAENYPYRSDHLWLTVPDHADWLYKTGEKAKVEVSFCLYGIPQNVEISYEIGPDMMPATASGISSPPRRSRSSRPSTSTGHPKQQTTTK